MSVRRDMIRFLRGIHGETQVEGLLIDLSAQEGARGRSGGALGRRGVCISAGTASFGSSLLL